MIPVVVPQLRRLRMKKPREWSWLSSKLNNKPQNNFKANLEIKKKMMKKMRRKV